MTTTTSIRRNNHNHTDSTTSTTTDTNTDDTSHPNHHHHTHTIEYSPCDNTGESHTSTTEEIQQQHSYAKQLVLLLQQQHELFPSSPPPPQTTQEIPISQKRHPIIHWKKTLKNIRKTNTTTTTTTLEDHPNIRDISNHNDNHDDHYDYICWSSRGTVDVTELQSLIQNGYNRTYDLSLSSSTTATTRTSTSSSSSSSSTTSTTNHNHNHSTPNYWDPQMAAQDNVYVRRPSHDAWGIPKIVLIYCDDCLQNIYTFPWYHLYFRNAVQPILDVLQIPFHRVARMLLASLPCDTTIPWHYDTGEWVKYTHRIHVPVLVQHPEQILFRCSSSTSPISSSSSSSVPSSSSFGQ